MRGFLGRIAANSGASLTVGGTILAIGVALGALGLAETAGTKQSPFDNGWVAAGLAVGGIGAVWVLGTFALAMRETARTQAFQGLLGRAHVAGNELLEENDSAELGQNWALRVYELIHEGLSEYEAELFFSHHDLGLPHGSPQPFSVGHAWIRRRLQRLSRLMDRAHALRARVDFDPRKFNFDVTWS